ncbi:transcriptional regulator BetI [Mesorhizobium sp. AR10]|uniref:transcriptional regulator BetI n=1 Tax=Mesorhizobium sp. AR10 TaxID=2865839 RepID=UPI0021603B15|nr:transcriptional regulator BetI [Mesorhizobium sp. AR10]UVK37407.1 transcriptional regulator BetI [Mesorhizobium sp. AR10]
METVANTPYEKRQRELGVGRAQTMGQHKTWPERREQLIEATIVSIHEDGLEKTSIQRIAKRAGLTAGIVGHYFGDKDGLLNATYDALYAKILANAERASHSQTSPTARVKSILLGYLSPDQLTPEIVSAWYVLVARLRQSPALQEIQSNAEITVRGKLRALLDEELSSNDAEALSRGLFAMVTGFWVLMASAPAPQDCDEHRKSILSVVDRFLKAYSLSDT